jgi:hypothetical protein
MINTDSIKVFIRSDPVTDSVAISFVTIGRNGKRYIAEPITLNFKEIGGAEATKPTLTIYSEVATPFLQAMAQALDERGIKTENDFKIQGLLEATKYHLEDLRKLIFNTGESK